MNANRACLAYELRREGFAVEVEVPIPVVYDNQVQIEVGYRADIIVEHSVVVELKAVEALIDKHDAQLLTHLRFGGFKVGRLLNSTNAI